MAAAARPCAASFPLPIGRPSMAPAPSLDNLAGLQQDLVRHGDTDGAQGLEVEDQVELGGQFHRQIGRFGAAQNAVDEADRSIDDVCRFDP